MNDVKLIGMFYFASKIVEIGMCYIPFLSKYTYNKYIYK